MKKHKLHQWLFLLTAIIFFASCSQKNFPGNNTVTDDKYSIPPSLNVPEPIIIIAEEKAKINKEGEMYYDNDYGYRYWRMADGKYYLDAKYESGAKPDKKLARKNSKQQRKKAMQKNTVDAYANNGI
jgi:hypothetical protein